MTDGQAQTAVDVLAMISELFLYAYLYLMYTIYIFVFNLSKVFDKIFNFSAQ